MERCLGTPSITSFRIIVEIFDDTPQAVASATYANAVSAEPTQAGRASVQVLPLFLTPLATLLWLDHLLLARCVEFGSGDVLAHRAIDDDAGAASTQEEFDFPGVDLRHDVD